jgi:hypothetical protein
MMPRSSQRKATLSRASGAVDQVKSALSNRYQSAGLITAQVLLPPDAVCRRLITGQQRLSSIESAKKNIVMRTLSNLHLRGEVDRRMGDDGVFEYRLPRTKHVGKNGKRGSVFKKILDAVANGIDPYSVHENKSTVNVYLWKLRNRNAIDSADLPCQDASTVGVETDCDSQAY